ncbi:hypothetical protein [Acidisphaera sp. S103]|uniref:hypothetical protein n=1 Tax=Acidisphaera sp. S103 TaxID=1747223 RepID=UPI001C2087EC|nr:hypothetical protein [Acidisphaera sp. S103]
MIRIWVEKSQAGALDDDFQAADLVQEYEARIAALERISIRTPSQSKMTRSGRCCPDTRVFLGFHTNSAGQETGSLDVGWPSLMRGMDTA